MSDGHDAREDDLPTVPSQRGEKGAPGAQDAPQGKPASPLVDEHGPTAPAGEAGQTPPAESDSDATVVAGGGASVKALHGREPDDPMLFHPEWVGPYRILDVLGEGGMGTVYRALREEPVRLEVALKLIKLGMDTREVVARFESERQALALMNHAHIAKVHDAGSTDQGRPYFVMEYVSGVPINTYCDKKALNIPRRLELFIQTCEGIQHAHQKAIIHRDLKPSNILVTEQDGKPLVKIIDFGIAKAVDRQVEEDALFTQEGQIIGTLEFMSPEQAAGQTHDLDTRTDIYSLGVILYEMLCGSLPFESRELRKVGFLKAQRIIAEEPPPPLTRRLQANETARERAASNRGMTPTSLTGRLRGDLEWILRKALAKKRDERYPSAGELAEELRRHLRHDPVLAGPPTARYRLKKFIQKHRGRVIGVIAFLVTLATYALVMRYLDYQGSITQSRSLRENAGAYSSSLATHRERRSAGRQALATAQRNYRPWQPTWERPRELELRQQLLDLEERIEQDYSRANIALQAARRVVPKPSEEFEAVKSAIAELNFSQYQVALRQGGLHVSPAVFRHAIEALNLESYAERLESGRVTLTVHPPDATVHCFRFVSHEEHLLPLPFDMRKGELVQDATSFLEVEQVWHPEETVLEPGDRLIRVGETLVASRGDVARAISGLSVGQRVPVQIRRGHDRLELEWTPFRNSNQEIFDLPLQEGRLIDIRRQLGVSFRGFPLETGPGCRLQDTSFVLPEGSYVFLVQKEGFRECRVPIAVPSTRSERSVRLFPESDVPDGYVHVPGGTFPYGGDPTAYKGLEPDEAHVDDFFMKRFEVTMREYLEFLNAPEVLSRTSAEGWLEVAADWDSVELKPFSPDTPDHEGTVQVVPFYRRRLFQRTGELGHWTPKQAPYLTLPLLGVSFQAGVEYAHWLTQKHDGRWHFRLPRDLEWEKAARGDDRRPYVWGKFREWTFCSSFFGGYGRKRRPVAPGSFPLDESVYGIRDLAGSMQEPLLERASEHLEFCILRGGGWTASDERDYRIATRNRRPHDKAWEFVGLRLVAEPPRVEAPH